MKVAVTGASGHLGAALCRELLAQGHQVRALVYRDDAALNGLPVERIRGSLDDIQSLEQLLDGAAVLQHLAGMISIGEWPVEQVMLTNVEGVRRVIEVCQRSGRCRLIFFSSIHAFQAPPVSEIFDENAPLAGEDAWPYERSKAAAQQLVLQAVQERGLDAIILNPSSVLGPWDFKPSRQGKLLLDLFRGRLPLLPDGGFDWVDNRDIAQAACRAMTAGIPGEAYLLSGHYARITELAQGVAAVSGRQAPQRTIPLWLLKSLAPLATWWSAWRGTPPLLTREAVSHLEAGHPRVSHLKASNAFGYAPRPLAETIQDTLAWFSEAGIVPALHLF